MKIITNIIYLSLLIVFTISCNSNSSSDPFNTSSAPLTEKQLKQKLLLKECTNGASNLDGKLSYSPKYKNALSHKVKGLKLTCNIKNNATLATLKDIKAKVVFKSKTGAKILEKTFNIYEFIAPKGSYKYKTEISITNQQYKDISKFEWTIISAKCK